MISFRNEKLKNFPIPAGSVWLMTDIAQSKGRQELYSRQTPQLLKSMKDMALVQSAESSNRIEGITIRPDRLPPLFLEMSGQKTDQKKKYKAIAKR